MVMMIHIAAPPQCDSWSSFHLWLFFQKSCCLQSIKFPVWHPDKIQLKFTLFCRVCLFHFCAQKLHVNPDKAILFYFSANWLIISVVTIANAAKTNLCKSLTFLFLPKIHFANMQICILWKTEDLLAFCVPCISAAQCATSLLLRFPRSRTGLYTNSSNNTKGNNTNKKQPGKPVWRTVSVVNV